MTSPAEREVAGAGTLAAPPHHDVTAVAALCRARLLEREGIAMFLAAHDARPGRRLLVTDQTTLAEGERLADLFDHYRAGLVDVAAPADPDPTCAAELIDILVVLSDQHLRARPPPPPPAEGAA